MRLTRTTVTCLALAAGLGGSAAALTPAALAATGPARTATATAATAIAATVPATTAPATTAPAAARPASTTAATGIGEFSTWRQAQTAAGFALRRPGRTHGLPRSATISVTRCDLPHRHSKRVVTAFYGSLTGRYLALGQNNSGRLCSTFTSGASLGTVKVSGVTAHLFGDCGAANGLPPCSSPGVFLQLLWKKDGVVFSTNSLSEPRRVLLNFSRHLHRVG
jgi:hypothetical protein